MIYNLSNKIIIIIIMSLSVAPAIFLGEGDKNLFLIGLLFITPIIFLKYFKIEKIDILLFAFIISIVIIPIAFNPESFRITTVLYTILFCLLFITYKQTLYASELSISNYLKLLKYIIYAYFIVLLIQQFSVLIGLPIFNLSNYNPEEPWKLNSLSAEPSHTARIVALLMYSYIVLIEIVKEKPYAFFKEIKNDKLIWLAFFWVMLTSNSGTAFIFLAIVFLKFIQFRNIAFLILFLIASIFLLNYLNITASERTFNFALAVLSLDINTMMHVDHSASIRVAPLIVLFNQIDLTLIQTWVGHGIDSTGLILDKYIYGVPKGFRGGGSLYLVYEYGLISYILFIVFSFLTVVKKSDYISLIFWFFLVFMYGINNQIVWLCMAIFFTIKYYSREKKIIE